ncbi:MAG TPA: invasion associated locus B family protein [Rickettsiales bacterium]|nr:invasion associated locus B family protein [Rickettsiales bacterium]
MDGIYYDWSVFVIDDLGEEKKCYIASFPKKSIGNYKDSREPYILITKFQNRGNEEVSIFSGFEYKIGSDIYISVDGKQYTLFTNNDIAWAKTKQQDKEIIEDMLDGIAIKVRAESSKAEYVVDEYSLKGITRAYKRMRELCKK